MPDEVPLPDEVPMLEQSSPSFDTRGDDDPAVDVPLFGRLSVNRLGLPAFTILIGLVDGFNPCAMWVLVFLLSILVNIRERTKIIAIAGTFVVVSGLAYFAFIAAWFNVFQLIGLLRPVQIGLGLTALTMGAINIKDFLAFHKGVSLSIPESAKPGIYRRVREIVSAKHMTVAIAGAAALSGRSEHCRVALHGGSPGALYRDPGIAGFADLDRIFVSGTVHRRLHV